MFVVRLGALLALNSILTPRRLDKILDREVPYVAIPTPAMAGCMIGGSVKRATVRRCQGMQCLISHSVEISDRTYIAVKHSIRT